jgi:hypothetical protein
MMLGLRRAGRRCAGFFLLGVLTVVSLSACGPTPQATPLPDLVIAIEARLKRNPLLEWGDGCIVSSSARLSPHVGEVTAHVRNVGNGDAGGFTVQLNNAATETVDGLKAGSSVTLVFSTSARSENVAVVDAGSSIDESDESNNTAEAFIPVPTIVPLPTCTPESR